MRKNSRLPNLHNLGVILRIILSVNLLGLLAVILQSQTINNFLPLLAELSIAIQPILLVCMIVLYALYPRIKKLDYRLGVSIIMGICVLIAALFAMFYTHYVAFEVIRIPYRVMILTAFITGIVLYYFNLLNRAYSPAIAEARLQALQARIRPHFLFNSINAVLSLIRKQPQRAEDALVDMSDLFRVLMAENRDLVPLENEIRLCKQYLEIESLRMEDRLQINWDTEDMPKDALVPPLILQPLLENAVYHGIDPIPEGGEITVNIHCTHNELHIKISNPYNAKIDEHVGNQMALKNIKERLTLHFDLEASIRRRAKDDQYTVNLKMPYVTES